MTLLGDLADCFVFALWRVSLMAHGAPQAASIVASNVSTRPWQVQHGERGEGDLYQLASVESGTERLILSTKEYRDDRRKPDKC